MSCKHTSVRSDCSKHAENVGYVRPTERQRIAAMFPSGRVPIKLDFNGEQKSIKEPVRILELLTPNVETFPAPLVLPEDELAWDPMYPPQSLRSWAGLKQRNAITSHQNVIYVVAPPQVASAASFVRNWAIPQSQEVKPAKRKQTTDAHGNDSVTRPDVQDVIEYLKAFYHGLPVKQLSDPKLRFRTWDEPRRSKAESTEKAAQPIALEAGRQCIRIRTRPSIDGIFSGQLNLSDLLDLAIDILPDDAYALLMLVQHDLYEDEDDDFCCGRAYGGSRVAVISMARYNPVLDERQKVEREHAWPASHCSSYIDDLCGADDSTGRPKKKSKTQDFTPAPSPEGNSNKMSPLRAAVAAHASLSSPAAPAADVLAGLWLGRVCKTSSHELGHCFGIDHCVYYACVMQGTAGLTEDARQPPYLCPVDLAKVLRATGASEVDRYRALLSFSERHTTTHLFASFAEWLRARIVPT